MGDAARPWEYSAFTVRVGALRRLSPGFLRLTLVGPALVHFAAWGLDQRIKLVLPTPDGRPAGDVGLRDEPTPHPSLWYARWKQLPEAERAVLRTYTPSAIRAEQAEIDVDVVLHEPPGPASTWAAAAQVGDELIVTGPDARQGWTGYGLHWHPGDARRFLLVGDETAFPALANILVALPAGATGTVLIEAGDPADDIVTAHAPDGITVRCVPRGDVAGVALERAVEEWGSALPAAPDESFYAWLAGESGAVTRIRRHLTGELGVPKERVSFLGYWRLGGPLVG
ncbi:siderophore-interacting protein [Microbacterium sp. NPDC089189]|uniref:siderophore-interacting protein n=1 Tax=Microbacterium sp. NPDC089189 TaxID=3154972 RepID=UPI0034458742